MTEKELAKELEVSVEKLAAMSEEELAGRGVTRIEPVNGRHPSNWKYAGEVYQLEGDLGVKYPEGVRFKETGYPDFSPYAEAQMEIQLTGSIDADFKLADKAAGLTAAERREQKLTWHHHEDGKTMQLVPSDLHDAVDHTGGVATSGLPYRVGRR